jgi:fructokinase
MIAAFGEALVDLIEQLDGRFLAALGGSVCNFAQAVGRQGVSVTYLNPLSQDTFGQRFAARLTSSGVILGAERTSTRPTALAVVTLNASGGPSYTFHRDAVADRDVTPEELSEHMPQTLQVLHTGGLALVPADLTVALHTMRTARERGALISVDANVRPMAVEDSATYFSGVKKALAQAHIIKVSDEDLAYLGLPGASPLEQARSLLAGDLTALVALTHGADDALLITRQHTVREPIPRNVQVVDTVGAGDCFHAGLLAWITRAGLLNAESLPALTEQQLGAALRHAVAAAAVNVSRAGCDPATWDETVAMTALLGQTGK